MIRPARPEDVPTLVSLVHELADYERSVHDVRLEAPALEAALFAFSPKVHCLVVDDEGEVAGMALWFVTFSTWAGRHGIYLEDLYVRPAHRGQGHGKAMLAELAARCVQNGYARLEWSVLDWNEPAIGLYRSLGAVPMDEWTVHRLTGDALTRLALTDAGSGEPV